MKQKEIKVNTKGVYNNLYQVNIKQNKKFINALQYYWVLFFII